MTTSSLAAALLTLSLGRFRADARRPRRRAGFTPASRPTRVPRSRRRARRRAARHAARRLRRRRCRWLLDRRSRRGSAIASATSRCAARSTTTGRRRRRRGACTRHGRADALRRRAALLVRATPATTRSADRRLLGRARRRLRARRVAPRRRPRSAERRARDRPRSRPPRRSQRARRRRTIGYFMAFRTLVAQGPEMDGAMATCSGPCTRGDEAVAHGRQHVLRARRALGPLSSTRKDPTCRSREWGAAALDGLVLPRCSPRARGVRRLQGGYASNGGGSYARASTAVGGDYAPAHATAHVEPRGPTTAPPAPIARSPSRRPIVRASARRSASRSTRRSSFAPFAAPASRRRGPRSRCTTTTPTASTRTRRTSARGRSRSRSTPAMARSRSRSSTTAGRTLPGFAAQRPHADRRRGRRALSHRRAQRRRPRASRSSRRSTAST